MPCAGHSSNGHCPPSADVCNVRQDEQARLPPAQNHTRANLRETSSNKDNCAGLARELTTILTVQRAISSPIDIDKLIEVFLVSAVQQAVAERGLLFLVGESGNTLQAEAIVRGRNGGVVFRSEPIATTAYPQSVLRYVIRMEEAVLLDNAFADNQFSGEEYFGSAHPRSILCLPLIVRREHIGVLYLENLPLRTFEPDQLAALELLTLQSTVLLKNELLRAELQCQASERKKAHKTIDRIRRTHAQLYLDTHLELKSQPLAILAHELNQPLQVIRSYEQTASRLLSMPYPQLTNIRTAIALINRHISRAADTIKSTTQLFQRDAHDMSAIDILEVLYDVYRIAQEDVKFNAAQIRLKLPESLPTVTGNKRQLIQASINLFLNGLEAMNDNNQHERILEIEAGHGESGWIYIALRDSGKGINDMDMPRIFDTFYSTKRHGTGMGLAIVRAIVENHGGTVWPIQNADRGATIMVELPICKYS
jgi:signal transduction histidine kinase